MLSGLAWLALEVKSLDRAVEFYQEHLDLPLRRKDGREAALGAGETDLLLRRPAGVPRGGLHTHYAFSCPADAYDDWWDRLSEDFDLHEETFGDVRSLYFYDTEGNCVEVMGRDQGSQTAITGLMEVVLEVEDLPRAEEFYTALGMEVVDQGDRRKRTRLTAGPFDLELWEPHLGLADARGGVHVDLGVYVDDPETATDAVWGRADRIEDLDSGAVRVRDPDGHYLTFVGE
ncbi:VOC family protein [Haloglomus salinum]|jgi:catechol-2,3-dioxygenase|uniref:VOC family protein n=1 Tax=Haloglomus salinum TaxID=2962673 RepID=UPI0020C96AF8|nr:VOC family protein [Haloglomus salinum]